MDRKVIPFNPLDKKHLGESVAQAMLRQPITRMTELKRFMGAGIYAIYYSGNFPAYEMLSRRNQSGSFSAPIYVGKAVPSGARKGGNLSADPGTALYGRLTEHKRSIEQVSNLDIADFFCRFLLVDDIWIPLGESLLITKFHPLWNMLIDGFGNHTPGKGRFKGMAPRWDVLHPGRPWAEMCEPRPETADQIILEARDHLRNNPPPDDENMITA